MTEICPHGLVEFECERCVWIRFYYSHLRIHWPLTIAMWVVLLLLFLVLPMVMR